MTVGMWGIGKVVNKQTQPFSGETQLVNIPNEGPFETEGEAQKRVDELGPEYVVRAVTILVR